MSKVRVHVRCGSGTRDIAGQSKVQKGTHTHTRCVHAHTVCTVQAHSVHTHVATVLMSEGRRPSLHPYPTACFARANPAVHEHMLDPRPVYPPHARARPPMNCLPSPHTLARTPTQATRHLNADVQHQRQGQQRRGSGPASSPILQPVQARVHKLLHTGSIDQVFSRSNSRFTCKQAGKSGTRQGLPRRARYAGPQAERGYVLACPAVLMPIRGSQHVPQPAPHV